MPDARRSRPRAPRKPRDPGPLVVPKPTSDEVTALDALGVSRETLERLADYVDRLAQWQRRINLIGPATMPEVWRRHIWDSAQLWPEIGTARDPILDIGSGAGFPGLVLGLLSADRDGPPVHLVESDTRKAAFLTDIAVRTGARVVVHPSRIEDLTAWPCSVVTARACASVSQILTFCAPFLGPESRVLLLKGQRVDMELTEAGEYWRFSAHTITSQTDPSGRVLCLSGISSKSSASD